MFKRWTKIKPKRELPRSCGKVVFESEAEATTRAFFLNTLKPTGHPQPLRPYRCGGCCKYHLSSKPYLNPKIEKP